MVLKIHDFKKCILKLISISSRDRHKLTSMAEHPPCFPEVNWVVSGCDEHQENLIAGNCGRDHKTQLGKVQMCDQLSWWLWWKLMPLTLCVLKDDKMVYTAHLAQGTGGGKVQFQVTLHRVTASNTQQQIFPRYLIIINPEKLVLLPEKKK